MRYIILTIPLLIGLIISSCISDDVNTSAEVRLLFSTDTVNFGTLITGVGSPTARLVVHNPSDKSIIISEISTGSSSVFTINVDGRNDNVFHDIFIRGGDSIYIFIECLIEPSSITEPYTVSDNLHFVTNGNMQNVRLDATAQNVIRFSNKTFNEDTVLSPELPYLIMDSLTVAPDVELTIKPATKIIFEKNAKLIVRGTLKVSGEAGNFISFSGRRTDEVFPGLSYQELAGQWDGIFFSEESTDNVIEYADIRTTSSGIVLSPRDQETSQTRLLIRNSWLHNSETSVLKDEGSTIEAYGVCFSDAGESVVKLKGGKHIFDQCTFANYYLFGMPSGSILDISGLSEADSEGGSPMEASFENGIIYGLGRLLSISDLEGSKVFMRSMLIGADGFDDNNFINCLWNKDPMFYTDRSEYIFNYRLKPDSPAIGAGNPAYINANTIFDMDGINRLADGNPALGAYASSGD